ncbi:uncharacterized protein VTP21DRAFT_4107 [Calcarisporiella thermophila]|uniref:uncharacterized protein n=1 Tax=Calcarisporiella thermophila TaxID=911321 RepID=UPI003742F8C5
MMFLGPDREYGREELSKALKLLQAFALIRQSLQEEGSEEPFSRGMVSIHPVVQRVTALDMEEMEKQKRFKWIISALRKVIPESYDESNEHSRKVMEICAPQIRYICQQFTLRKVSEEEPEENSNIIEEFVSLLIPTVIFLVRRGLFEDAEYLAKLAVSASNAIKHPLNLARAESCLCYLFLIKGDFISAEVHCRNALDIRKRVLTFGHKLT